MGLIKINKVGCYDYYLEPEYESAKSYYRKAKVYCNFNDIGEIKTLYSYSTPVAKVITKYENNEKIIIYELYRKYSKTTSRHQKEFLLQEGLDLDNIKKLLNKGGSIEIYGSNDNK